MSWKKNVDVEECVELDVIEVVRITKAGILVLVEGGEEIWLPKSHVFDSERFYKGEMDTTMAVTKWIAREKGIEWDE